MADAALDFYTRFQRCDGAARCDETKMQMIGILKRLREEWVEIGRVWVGRVRRYNNAWDGHPDAVQQ